MTDRPDQELPRAQRRRLIAGAVLRALLGTAVPRRARSTAPAMSRRRCARGSSWSGRSVMGTPRSLDEHVKASYLHGGGSHPAGVRPARAGGAGLVSVPRERAAARAGER